MRHKQFAVLIEASAVALMLTVGSPTAARAAGTNGEADENERMMEEIVVTSRKMGAESLQDIPAAISALDRRALDEGMVVDFEDFARQVPGLTFQDSAPGEKRYVIRGITSAGQQQVAVYYDEVPLPGVQSSTSNSGSQTTDLKLYDMERVEVLRGPQGTAFGANSQGGTVRFITTQPKLDKWEAYVSGELSQTDPSSDSNWNYQAVMNLPLGETFGLRVLAYDGKDAGYIDNTRCRPTDPAEDPRVPGTQLSCLNLKDLNWAETTGFRTNLLWQASEKATIKGQFWWQKRDTGGDSSYMPFDAFNPNPTDKHYAGNHDTVPYFAFFEEGEFKTGDYAQTPKPDEQWIYALTGEFNLPFADLTATASRYERDYNYKFDSTWQILALLCPSGNLNLSPSECGGSINTPRPDLLYALTDQTQSLEQNAFELRLNSNDSGSAIKWVIGGFWRERKSYFHSYVPVINGQGLVPSLRIRARRQQGHRRICVFRRNQLVHHRCAGFECWCPLF